MSGGGLTMAERGSEKLERNTWMSNRAGLIRVGMQNRAGYAPAETAVLDLATFRCLLIGIVVFWLANFFETIKTICIIITYSSNQFFENGVCCSIIKIFDFIHMLTSCFLFIQRIKYFLIHINLRQFKKVIRAWFQYLGKMTLVSRLAAYTARRLWSARTRRAEHGEYSASILATTPEHRWHVMPATFRLAAQLRLRKCQQWTELHERPVSRGLNRNQEAVLVFITNYLLRSGFSNMGCRVYLPTVPLHNIFMVVICVLLT